LPSIVIPTHYSTARRAILFLTICANELSIFWAFNTESDNLHMLAS
jgi:hypothetical protein